MPLPKSPPNKIVKIRAPLTPGEMRFVEEYVLDLDVAAASHRANITPEEGAIAFQRKHVLAAIQVVKSARAVRTGIYADHVLRRWWDVVTADPRELIEVRRCNCRYCHGMDFDYQFTLNEMRQARRNHVEAMKHVRKASDRFEFDERGGDGFDRYRDPNPDCPECMGKGIEMVYVHDSRTYSPGAAALYQGVEISDKGKMRVLMRDKGEVEKLVAQHLGMFVNRNINLTLDPMQMSDEQLAAAIEQFESLTAGHDPGGSGPLLEHAPQGDTEAEDG